MTQRFEGLFLQSEASAEAVPAGWYLVRVVQARYSWQRQKPYYVLQLSVEEPGRYAQQRLFGRLECTAKVLWKLGWFLRDFGYDPERLRRDEVDTKSMIGLRGVVRISPLAGTHGSLVSFDGFAPQEEWPKLAATTAAARQVSSSGGWQ
jgi:hypothetical protein